jgi:DNA-binding NtrC family response regulator
MGRITASRLRLPPLRERREDVAVLASRFWLQFGGRGGVPADLLAELTDRSWPGNVRQLRDHVLERTAHAADPSGKLQMAANRFFEIVAGDLPFSRARQAMIDEFERQYMVHMLVRYQGHVAKAAAASGIALRYFQLLRARHRAFLLGVELA